MQKGKSLQLLASALLVIFIGLAGGLMAIPLLLREPLQVVRPGVPALLAHTANGEPANVEIRIAGSGNFMLLLESVQDGVVSEALIGMPLRNRPPRSVPVERLRDNLFMATGRLELTGQWRVTIAFGGNEAMEVDFILADF